MHKFTHLMKPNFSSFQDYEDDFEDDDEDVDIDDDQSENKEVGFTVLFINGKLFTLNYTKTKEVPVNVYHCEFIMSSFLNYFFLG